MHKKPQPPSSIIYFWNLIKSLCIPFKYYNFFLTLKHRPYSVAIRFKGMSRHYMIMSIKLKNEIIRKGGYREVLCMFLGVVHLDRYYIKDSYKTVSLKCFYILNNNFKKFILKISSFYPNIEKLT
jgi:hypothetical protein